jgi:HJR/Mrr/RecB family endonuclease
MELASFKIIFNLIFLLIHLKNMRYLFFIIYLFIIYYNIFFLKHLFTIEEISIFKDKMKYILHIISFILFALSFPKYKKQIIGSLSLLSLILILIPIQIPSIILISYILILTISSIIINFIFLKKDIRNKYINKVKDIRKQWSIENRRKAYQLITDNQLNSLSNEELKSINNVDDIYSLATKEKKTSKLEKIMPNTEKKNKKTNNINASEFLFSDQKDKKIEAQLKNLRMTIADIANYAPYHVFTNNQLKEFMDIKPQCKNDFLAIPKMGEKKFNLFGEQLIKIFNPDYNPDKDIATIEINGKIQDLIILEESDLDPIDKGLLFEQWCFKFLNNYFKNKVKKIIKTKDFLEKDKELKEKLTKVNTFGSDLGSDLIVELKNNERILIQCKYKDHAKKANHKGLQEVLAIREFFNATKIILFTNTDFNKHTYELAKIHEKYILRIINREYILNTIK